MSEIITALLAFALAASSAHAGFFGPKELTAEDVRAAESCLTVTDWSSTDSMAYPELAGDVAEVVIAKGWLTAAQVKRVQEAGVENVQLGMTPCEVVWTQRMMPVSTKTYESTAGKSTYWHYNYGTTTVRFEAGVVTSIAR